MLEFIRVAATTIIKSPQYSNESLSYDSEEDSPDYVYERPFFFGLIEDLDPITWHYMRKVGLAVK